MSIGESRDYDHGECIECDATAEWSEGDTLSCPECGGKWTALYNERDDGLDYVQFENEDGEIDAVVELEDEKA